MQEALKIVIPGSYQAFIHFDANGKLDLSTIISIRNQGIFQQSDMLDALIYIAQNTINIEIFLGDEWVGRTASDPLGHNYTFVNQAGPFTKESLSFLRKLY